MHASKGEPFERERRQTAIMSYLQRVDKEVTSELSWAVLPLLSATRAQRGRFLMMNVGELWALPDTGLSAPVSRRVGHEVEYIMIMMTWPNAHIPFRCGQYHWRHEFHCGRTTGVP